MKNEGRSSRFNNFSLLFQINCNFRIDFFENICRGKTTPNKHFSYSNQQVKELLIFFQMIGFRIIDNVKHIISVRNLYATIYLPTNILIYCHNLINLQFTRTEIYAVLQNVFSFCRKSKCLFATKRPKVNLSDVRKVSGKSSALQKYCSWNLKSKRLKHVLRSWSDSFPILTVILISTENFVYLHKPLKFIYNSLVFPFFSTSGNWIWNLKCPRLKLKFRRDLFIFHNFYA